MRRKCYSGTVTSSPRSDILYCFLGVLFAISAGYFHVQLNDSGLSVLAVAAATMFLAYMRPQRAWRWALLMGLCLPAATLIAQLNNEKPSLGMIAGSFAGLAFAVVAAIGGVVLRRIVAILFPPKSRELAAEPEQAQKTSTGS